MIQTTEQKNKIEFAKEFARKKFIEVDMDNHFLEVYKILQEDFLVDDSDILISGLLHDTLEDTNTTSEELEQVFSKPIAEMVEEVSHPKNYNHEQRLEFYEKLKHISNGAKLIKLADFTSHLTKFIEIYKKGEQNLHPKFVNNDKYAASIKDFCSSCLDSKAKDIVLKLTSELESYL